MSDEPRILVLNAGSSSIKCGVYPLAGGGRRSIGIQSDFEAAGGRLTIRLADGPVVHEAMPHPAGGEIIWQVAVRILLSRALAAAGGPVVAVGHRIVH